MRALVCGFPHFRPGTACELRPLLVGSGELAEIAIPATRRRHTFGPIYSDAKSESTCCRYCAHGGRGASTSKQIVSDRLRIGPFADVVITDSRTPGLSYEEICERLSKVRFLMPVRTCWMGALSCDSNGISLAQKSLRQ